MFKSCGHHINFVIFTSTHIFIELRIMINRKEEHFSCSWSKKFPKPPNPCGLFRYTIETWNLAIPIYMDWSWYKAHVLSPNANHLHYQERRREESRKGKNWKRNSFLMLSHSIFTKTKSSIANRDAIISIEQVGPVRQYKPGPHTSP